MSNLTTAHLDRLNIEQLRRLDTTLTALLAHMSMAHPRRRYLREMQAQVRARVEAYEMYI